MVIVRYQLVELEPPEVVVVAVGRPLRNQFYALTGV
jgi:hypothetical protein